MRGNADVLAAFGIVADTIRDIRAGRVNRHWHVVAGGSEYALRRYARTPFVTRTSESIAFEHEAIRRAAAKGWPVATPIPSLEGDTLVERDGSLWSLFPFLAGRPATTTSARHLRIKGRLLARLHADMADLGPGEQRVGFGRMWELDGYMGSGLPLNEMLRTFSESHNDASWTVRGQRYRNLRELSRVGYGDLPDQFCHFDFHRDNLLFADGELSGLLDFDSSHLDARVADIATSIALDCLEPPTYEAISPEATRAFVEGYAEGSRLTEQEQLLIVPLVRSWIIAAAAGRIAQWLRAPDPAVESKIGRTVGRRIPAFELRREALERAVRDAVAAAAAR